MEVGLVLTYVYITLDILGQPVVLEEVVEVVIVLLVNLLPLVVVVLVW